MTVKVDNGTGIVFAENHISGTIAAGVQKGNYYMTVRSGTHYYLATRPTTYSCSPGMKDYGFFMNTMTDVAHRRFESSVRIKIVVDRADQSGPILKQSIEDARPIVGQKFTLDVPIATYF